MEEQPQFANFARCLKLRDLGFPQKRKFQSMYYARPDMLICMDDLSALKSDGLTDFENIFATLIFKPRLEELVEESGFLREVIKMDDGSFFAYSNVNEDEEYILRTGRKDPYLRARGATVWDALVNLYIAVKEKEKRTAPDRTLTPEELDQSENREEHTVVDPNQP